MSREVLCRYCITAGFGFRPMTKRSVDTEEYVCLGCGHRAQPDNPHSLCACSRCESVERNFLAKFRNEVRTHEFVAAMPSKC